MRKRLLVITSIVVVLALAFVGCSAKNESTSDSMAPQPIYEKTAVEAEMVEEAGFGGMDSVAYDSDDKETSRNEASSDGEESVEELSEKIIYNVYTSIQVTTVDVAVSAITEKVKALGGYISYANTYNSNGYNYANIEVRVPSKKLSMMEEFTYEIGEVKEYTMSTDNITESYYDIKARLNHSLVQEEQLVEIMKQAVTIEEVLLVRAELDGVQERIESYKGRLKVWDSLVDYSTITYSIEPIPTLDTTEDGPRIIKLDETWRAMKRGFNNSWIAVVNFFSFLLRAIAVLFVPILICGIIVVAIILIVKKSRKNRKEKQEKK